MQEAVEAFSERLLPPTPLPSLPPAPDPHSLGPSLGVEFRDRADEHVVAGAARRAISDPGPRDRRVIEPRDRGVTAFGGFTPFVATWLIAVTGNNLSPNFYIMLTAALSITLSPLCGAGGIRDNIVASPTQRRTKKEFPVIFPVTGKLALRVGQIFSRLPGN
jgi:hypothetical protein